MKQLLKITATALIIGNTYTANAALLYGAEALSAVTDCPSFCTNFNFGPSTGAQGIASSELSSINETRGSASASAALSGGLSTPVLKAKSAANAILKGAFSSAFALQGYTYNGPGETLTLNINLNGVINDPEMDASDTNVSLDVVLYQTNPFIFFTSHRPTLEAEAGAKPLKQPNNSEASLRLQLDWTNPTSASGSISLNVATGDEFYLYALLGANSKSGTNSTSADAFNTGTMSFLGNPNLVAAGVVPVPAAMWLFGSGLIGLVGIARRKNT